MGARRTCTVRRNTDPMAQRERIAYANHQGLCAAAAARYARKALRYGRVRPEVSVNNGRPHQRRARAMPTLQSRSVVASLSQDRGPLAVDVGSIAAMQGSYSGCDVGDEGGGLGKDLRPCSRPIVSRSYGRYRPASRLPVAERWPPAVDSPSARTLPTCSRPAYIPRSPAKGLDTVRSASRSLQPCHSGDAG